VNEVLGSKSIARLTVDDVEQAYKTIALGSDKREDGKPRKPAGVAYLRRMRFVLVSAVEDGIRRGVLSDSIGRVVSNANLPRAFAAPKGERRAMTSDEMRSLVEASKTHRLHALFLTALSTGMRPGELTGLHWSDLHLDADPPYLELNHAVQRQLDNSYRVVDVMKNAGAYRDIEVTPTVVAALREHRKAQNVVRLAAKSWANPDLVFASRNGTALMPSNVRTEYTKVCALAGVDRIVPYETRHSYATMLTESTMNTYAIIDIMGHTDDRMLNRHYRKRRKGVVRGATDVVDRVLSS
jgi:integrase